MSYTRGYTFTSLQSSSTHSPTPLQSSTLVPAKTPPFIHQAHSHSPPINHQHLSLLSHLPSFIKHALSHLPSIINTCPHSLSPSFNHQEHIITLRRSRSFGRARAFPFAFPLVDPSSDAEAAGWEAHLNLLLLGCFHASALGRTERRLLMFIWPNRSMLLPEHSNMSLHFLNKCLTPNATNSTLSTPRRNCLAKGTTVLFLKVLLCL